MFALHHHQVMRLLTGHSADVIQSTAVTSFFLTSSFHPAALPSACGCEEAWLLHAWHQTGFSQLRMNHTTATTKEIYTTGLAAVRAASAEQSVEISEIDLVPFYW